MGINTYLQKQTSIYPLITFRILFGILIMISGSRFMYMGWIEEQLVNPTFHFKYYGFEWIEPLSLYGMYGIYILMIISALGVTLGYRYRLSSILLFLTFTYTELIDISYYLNHYYYVSIVTFLFIFLPLNKAVSLDVKQGRTSFVNTIPAWMLHVIMLMIGIVYFYAGLAKINYDWLFNALPLKIWLPAHDNLPIIGFLFKYKWVHYAFAWTGMLYDTLIVFALLYKPTRKIAFVSVVIFHTLTGILFQIGVFPIVMICGATIFCSAEWHRTALFKLVNLVDKYHIKNIQQKDKVQLQANFKHRIITVGMGIFFIFQILFPWRYLLYPGNIFWTEEGYRFSWRVMLMEKSGTVTFTVKDGDNGREGQVFNGKFLNPHQEKQMAMQPDMILQYAHHIGKYYKSQGMKNPKVRVEAYVTLNGAPSKILIDPQIDLIQVNDGWQLKNWVTIY